MSLAYEKNTNLAFNTDLMRSYAAQYESIANDLIAMAAKLDKCIQNLSSSGWTTPAGDAFYKLTQANWEKNIKIYADLLITLKDMLNASATEYERLVSDYIETTKIR